MSIDLRLIDNNGNAIGGGINMQGKVEFRSNLPLDSSAAIGDVYLVEKPTTILFGSYTTYQSGLYMKDLDTGSLSDWRRLNIKTRFTESEFRIVSTTDQSKQIEFETNMISPSSIRAIQMPDKDVDLDSFSGPSSGIGVPDPITSTGRFLDDSGNWVESAQLLTNESQLPTPIGGVITLDKFYNPSGTVTITNQIDCNGFGFIGETAHTDCLNYTGTLPLFIGGEDVTLNHICIISPLAKVFQVSNVAKDKVISIDNVTHVSCSDIGDITGFSVVSIDKCQYTVCSNGIEFINTGDVYITLCAYSASNSGTQHKFTGTINNVGISQTIYDVSVGATGIDVSGLTSVTGFGNITDSVVSGGGTNYVGTFDNEWTVNSKGLPKIGDDYAKCWIKMNGTDTDTALTVNTWEVLDINGVDLVADSTHRFQQFDTGANQQISRYIGTERINTTIVASLDVTRLGGGTNTYEFAIIVRAAVLEGYAKTVDLGASTTSVTIVAQTYLDPSEYWYVGVRNITDNDDIRVKSCSLLTF